MTTRTNPAVTIAPADQRRIWLIAKIKKQKPSQAVAAAMQLYYELHEYQAIEDGYEDAEVSAYAEELCKLIAFELVNDDDELAIPAHRR